MLRRGRRAAVPKVRRQAAESGDWVRFLAPALQGRAVGVLGAVPPGLEALCQATSVCPVMLTALEAGGKLEAVLCFDPQLADMLMQHAPALSRAWPDALFGALAVSAAAFRSVAAHHMAHYVVRPLTGAVIADARFADSRFTALRDAGSGPALHLLLWSDAPLPELRPGLFETRAAGLRVATRPAEPANPPDPPVVEDDRVVSLTERLLRVEARTLALRGENHRLRAQATGGPVATAAEQGGFDVPRTTHPWPLAETPSRPPGTLELYDRRPDDSVIIEAAQGDAFLAQFRLLDDDADFAGAVAALNDTPRHLPIVEKAPYVSIVIPVYGQLAYTLNCLDSLFRHEARYTVEIIVVDDASPDEVTPRLMPQIRGVRYHRQPQNGGFVESCNSGAQVATGRFLLLLNNDTRAAAGWLDALLDSFVWFPRAGLVGSKMFQPDGRLLEAGDILWRDGSAWNYGREDDPNRPQYCYARRVDYISGCAIVLPMRLWRQLDGLDRYFAPAYAEDADLCQRVIAQGREVWFQPASRLIHYEGRTSGTSTESGAKAYQVVNLRKLFLRWRTTFETHRRPGEAPFFERERSVRKRLLVVDAVTPTPNQDAGSVQTVLALRSAQACGYKTSFVPEDNWLFEPGYTQAMQQEGIDCSYAPFEVGFENYIRRYGALFDVILVYRVTVMTKCLTLLREHAPQAIVLFHVADLHYLRTERQARLEGSPEGLRAAALLKDKELGIVRRADCTITHSTVEAEILAEEVPGAPVVVWPLMFDFFGTKIGYTPRRDLCFLGGYRHPPNVDAVEYFVRDVFPLVKKALPDVRFIIAGANPTQAVQDLASEDVIVTGMIEDLREVFDKTRVFVCPLRYGAGAKGKVLSAMSYGVPIVSTSVGVEGAGLQDGKHMLTAETPDDLAAAILRLYRDRSLWETLSQNGQALVRESFSTGMGARKLQEAVDAAYLHSVELAH